MTVRRFILAVFTALFLLTLFLAALIFWPFAPLSVENLRTVSNEVCPLENVEANADVNIEAGWDLKRLSIESTWVPVGDNPHPPAPGGVVVLPNPSLSLAEGVRSPAVRLAPGMPGEYRLVSEAEMTGTFPENNFFHGWPKIQRIEYASENTLRVLPSEADGCGRNS